jgi:chitosanase
MINPATKLKIQTIVSVFETSSLKPRYDILVCLNDGPRKIKQITYGKHQTTEYGNLQALIRMYCDRHGRYENDLRSYLAYIGNPKHPLAGNDPFKMLLKLAGTDDIMHQVQDEFFDRYYWDPAVNFFTSNLFNLPLAMAVIYDSYIHSGGIPSWLRDDFKEVPPVKGGNEKDWVKAYVTTRDYWLEHHENKILRGTDYRTDAWLDCIALGNWELQQPVVCKFNSTDKRDWITIP